MSAKDKEIFVLNPITGELDLVRAFNENRIIVSEYNLAGSRRMTYDAFSGTHVDDGPIIVVDNNGNVVVT